MSRRIALALATTLVTGLLLEGLFRTLDQRGFAADRVLHVGERVIRTASQRTPGVSVQYRPNRHFEITYDSNPRGYFNDRNGLVYRLNNYGFRGPDIQRQKPPETERVALLGDSFTFGEGVRWEDTFAERLEETLASQQEGRALEVLNFGHSMWSTSDEIHHLAHEARYFRPDLVLVVFVLNDADYAGDLDFYNRFRAIYEPTGPIRHSYLLSYIQATLGRQVYGQLYSRTMLRRSVAQRAKWERSLALLARGKELAASVGARYGVVIFPFMYNLDRYPFVSLHDRVADFARRRDIPVLDLLPSLSGEHYLDLWAHPSDPHPNERAHAIAARAMAEFVRSENLLGDATRTRLAER